MIFNYSVVALLLRFFFFFLLQLPQVTPSFAFPFWAALIYDLPNLVYCRIVWPALFLPVAVHFLVRLAGLIN